MIRFNLVRIRLILVDKKILSGGLVMLIVGIALLLSIKSTMPAGNSEMREEEIRYFIIKEQENTDMNILASILTSVRFLVVLMSLGARKKTKGGPKKEEKKPTT